MQTIGILGGMAPESTVEYYRTIIEASHDKGWDKRYPQTIINSLNFEDFYRPLSAGDDDRVLEVLTGGIDALERAGADFALLASNTPHAFAPEVEAATALPLLSIVDATGEAAVERGFERIGLLGTRFTMDGDFYPRGFDEHDLDVVTPPAAEKQWIHDVIFEELTNGVFTAETKVELVRIVESLQETADVDAVALACTELPLILDDDDLPVPSLNTTALHANAAFDRAVEADRAVSTQ